MRKTARIAALIAGPAIVIGGSLAAGAGAASASPNFVTAITHVTNRDDSGTNSNGTTNNWAQDNYTRTATITSHGVTSVANCPGMTSGICHYWTGQVKDNGTFTTVPGDAVPGQGGLNGGNPPLIGTAVTGSMKGTYNFKFYSDAGLSGATATVPTAVDGTPPGTETSHWVEQFFAPGTRFWDGTGNLGGAEGTTGSWTYTAPFGSDHACPHAASQWVDGSATSWGGNASDGNIFAPDAAHC